MTKTRLEAFSDGVLAIIITIMALELKAPHGNSLESLKPLVPVFMSYITSFAFIGIYWNNHHHTMLAVHKITGNVLWANLHLLFWLSLIPFATAWIGVAGFTTWPIATYGVILFFSGTAYYILTHVLIACPEVNPTLAKAVGADWKGKISVATYIVGIALAFLSPGLSYTLYVLVALLWFVPDRRIERAIISQSRP